MWNKDNYFEGKLYIIAKGEWIFHRTIVNILHGNVMCVRGLVLGGGISGDLVLQTFQYSVFFGY